ncbi:MAG: hypothetical protein JST85_07795 [Acidobacteria bacterium]|nr:hypothetical protein [Acidobacteriota bacterium]
MFTIQSENQSAIRKLVLSEATCGIFGIIVLVIMLFFAFAGTASVPNKQSNAQASPGKPANSGLMAGNMKRLK